MRKQNFNDFRDFLYSSNIKIKIWEEHYNELETNDEIEVECSCGEIYRRTYYKFKNLKHKLCNQCNSHIIKSNKSKAKRQKNKFNEIIKNNNLILISGEYINQQSKIILKCHSCRDEFTTRGETIFHIDCRFCKSCKLKNSTLKYDVDKKIKKLQSKGYKNVKHTSGDFFKFICHCGEEAERKYNNLINVSLKCKLCTESIVPLPISEVESKVPNNLIWVSGIYKNQNSILSFKCECGECFSTTMASLKYSTVGCKKCAVKIRVNNTRITRVEKGDWIKDELLSYKKLYYKLVDRFTKVSLKYFDTSKVGRSGESGAHHVDHIYSRFDGFNNNIPPWIIGSHHNLRIIPWEENLIKHRNSHISIDILYKKVGY